MKKLYEILGIMCGTSVLIVFLHFFTGQDGWKVAVGVAALSLTGILITYINSKLRR